MPSKAVIRAGGHVRPFHRVSAAVIIDAVSGFSSVSRPRNLGAFPSSPGCTEKVAQEGCCWCGVTKPFAGSVGRIDGVISPSPAGHQSDGRSLIAPSVGHQSDGRSLIAPSVGLLGRSAFCASSSPGRSECVFRPGRLHMPATWPSDSHAAASTRPGLRLRSRLAASRQAAFPNPDAIHPGRAASSFTPLRLPRSTFDRGRSASSERSHGFNGIGT